MANLHTVEQGRQGRAGQGRAEEGKSGPRAGEKYCRGSGLGRLELMPNKFVNFLLNRRG